MSVSLSAKVEPRLKVLAELRVAAIVACEHCLDIGSALGAGEGVTERQLRELHEFRSSDAFDGDERLVLELAEAMTRAPWPSPGRCSPSSRTASRRQSALSWRR